MTTTSPTPIVQNQPKSSWFSGCIVTTLAIVFAVLGFYYLISASIVTYFFTSAQMFSIITIAIVLIIACVSFIYFFLAFRIKRQHWLISLALVALVLFVLPELAFSLINTVTARIRIDGHSMETTLSAGSFIIANKLAYQQNDPQRGDLVLISYPRDPKQFYLKRVIGLPGESVAVKGGTVTINGIPLEEPYITEPPVYSDTWIVPEGTYFVLGDNRNNSSDSHNWGPVPRENITAKAVWIYFPLANVGKIADVNFPP